MNVLSTRGASRAVESLKFALPAVLVAFAAGMSSFAPAQDKVTDAAKAQALINKAIKAMGGAKALHKSRHAIIEDEGTYLGMGDAIPYKGRYVYSYGKKSRSRMEIIGMFVQVFDGEKAWMSAMGQTSDAEGVALDVAKQAMEVSYAMSLLPLEKPNKAYKLSLAKQAMVNEETCPGVQVEHEGMPTLTMHFSPKSGLISKTSYTNRAPEQGFEKVVEEAIFHAYKLQAGVMTPTHMTIFRDGKKYVVSKPQKVTYPDTVDDSEFKKPE